MHGALPAKCITNTSAGARRSRRTASSTNSSAGRERIRTAGLLIVGTRRLESAEERGLPQFVVVKLRGQREQVQAGAVEDEPRDEKTRADLRDRPQVPARAPRLARGGGQLFQACRADDAVVVLGDALAAVKVPALRAARDRLAREVIETALARDGAHADFGADCAASICGASRWSSRSAPRRRLGAASVRRPAPVCSEQRHEGPSATFTTHAIQKTKLTVPITLASTQSQTIAKRSCAVIFIVITATLAAEADPSSAMTPFTHVQMSRARVGSITNARMS